VKRDYAHLNNTHEV